MAEAVFWRHLQAHLTEAVRTFPGIAGIAMQDLHSGHEVQVQADMIFTTGSVMKLGVLAALGDRAARGEIDLDRRMLVPAGTRVPGSGILTQMESDVRLCLRDVAALMILLSDNVAANICLEAVGMNDLNRFFRRIGLHETTCRHIFDIRHAATETDENVSTPAELVRLLHCLYQADGIPAEGCDFALGILKRQRKGFLNKAIKGVPVANKPGAVGYIRNDCGIVYLPARPYLLAVMTKYGSEAGNEQFVIDIARRIHNLHMLPLSRSNWAGGIPPTIF